MYISKQRRIHQPLKADKHVWPDYCVRLHGCLLKYSPPQPRIMCLYLSFSSELTHIFHVRGTRRGQQTLVDKHCFIVEVFSGLRPPANITNIHCTFDLLQWQQHMLGFIWILVHVSKTYVAIQAAKDEYMRSNNENCHDTANTGETSQQSELWGIPGY